MKLIFVAIIFSLVFKIIFALKFYRKLSVYKAIPNAVDKYPGISVLISAKNEAVNLNENLISILEQDHPDFEVLVADDHSSDNSLQVLKEIQLKYKHLIIIEKENFPDKKGKKYALNAAIAKSNKDHLLFTDADCKPASDKWIQLISRHFIKPETEIVLAYSPYLKIKNSYLNKFIRYETILTAMKYFGFALNNNAFMGVGRNMAYKKECFIKANAFESHLNIISGDDDLSISKMADNTNVAIEISEESWMMSKPESTFKNYKNQKKRHVSTAKYYSLSIKLWLAIYAIAHITFYITFFILLFSGYIAFALFFYILYTAIIVLESVKPFRIFKEESLIKYLLLFDISFLIYYSFTFYNALFKSKPEW